MSPRSARGRAWVFGDNVDTDQLAPGEFMKGPIEILARHCLGSLDPDFAGNVTPGDVIVAGRNFGMGSSREQAVEALKVLGLSAVIAKSFAGIFFRNAINLGVPVFTCRRVDDIVPGARVEIDIDQARLLLHCQGDEIELDPLPKFLLALIHDGGLVPHLQNRFNSEAGKS